MLHRKNILLAVAFLIGLSVMPAHGYVDLAPTLARIAREAQTIVVAEVVSFSQEKGAVALKKVRDLKGKTGDDLIKHQLVRSDESTIDAPIADWAEPGQRCVIFITGKAAVICVGEGWYQAYAQDNGWWRIGAPRPDLPLAYHGTVSRLTEALPAILAGKTAVITTLPHGANREGASFDLALNRANLPGLVKMQRLRAGLTMPEMAMGVGANPTWVVGPGRVGKEDLEPLCARLKSTSPAERAESATEIGYFGADGGAAIKHLTPLLDDSASSVRLAAAASLIRIAGKNERAVKVLGDGIADKNPATRRQASRLAGFGGAAAAPLADALAGRLKDDDVRVRRSALHAIATLGPAAANARAEVTGLLTKSDTAVDAADALGRLGQAARPSMSSLAKLLKSEAPAERWAAVRAMSQIGGPDAMPAVKFMTRELPKAGEADGYNMLIYLSLLGPIAKDATQAVRTCKVRNPILKQTTLWAIDPTTDLPNMGGFGPFGDADFMHFILEAYVSELGDHLKPAAQKLAKNIMAGKAGNVPPWGYKLLARFPDDSLAVFSPALKDGKLQTRERATVAIGYMGRAAKGARPQVAEALRSSTDEREQLLLQWCLREIE